MLRKTSWVHGKMKKPPSTRTTSPKSGFQKVRVEVADNPVFRALRDATSPISRLLGQMDTFKGSMSDLAICHQLTLTMFGSNDIYRV
jgi:hypothetical protein